MSVPEVFASPEELRGALRLGVVALALALLATLTLASRLEPDPAGHGTHRQLGLPPCSIVAFFGVRCPSCGMTTSWAHVTRGQLPSAARANVTGAVLAGMAILAVPWLLISAARGRWQGWTPTSTGAAWGGGAVLAAMTVEWCVRLATTG